MVNDTNQRQPRATSEPAHHLKPTINNCGHDRSENNGVIEPTLLKEDALGEEIALLRHLAKQLGAVGQVLRSVAKRSRIRFVINAANAPMPGMSPAITAGVCRDGTA